MKRGGARGARGARRIAAGLAALLALGAGARAEAPPPPPSDAVAVCGAFSRRLDCRLEEACGWVDRRLARSLGRQCVPAADFCRAKGNRGERPCRRGRFMKEKCQWLSGPGGGCRAKPPVDPSAARVDWECGLKSTQEPRVFGPGLWRSLHIFANFYPESPLQDVQSHCVKFLQSLPVMLPSSTSGKNLLDFMLSHPGGAEAWCSAKGDFVQFFLDAHNFFNERTVPGRPAWTRKMATEAYTVNKRFQGSCRHNPVWNGRGPMCKSTDDAPYTTWPPDENTCQTYEQNVNNVPARGGGGVNPYAKPPKNAGRDGSGSGDACWGGLVEEGCKYHPWAGIDIYPWKPAVQAPWAGGAAELTPLGPATDSGSAQAYACNNGTQNSITFQDPRSFGPVVWPALHVIAHGYPQAPREDVKTYCQEYLKSLPVLLPCSHCANDFLNFVQEGAKNFYEPKRGEPLAVTACESRGALVDFFLQAHNNVNRHTNPQRGSWSKEEAADRYTREFVCFHSAAWDGPSGGVGLCREASSASSQCSVYTPPR